MSGASKDGRRSERRQTLEQVLRWAGRFSLLALAVLFIWGSLEVRKRVRSDPRFRIVDRQLSLGDLPSWAPEEMRQDLEKIRVGGTDEDPLLMFSPKVLDRIRYQILVGCSWVRDVQGIRLRPPAPQGASRGAVSANTPGSGEIPAIPDGDPAGGSIEVQIKLRIPVAVVEAGGTYTLVDREGVRMGPDFEASRLPGLGVPAIVGGDPRRPRRVPQPGFCWEDRDVREGLEVAKVLFDAKIAEQFPDAPVERIDITNVGERAQPGECEIYLTAGKLRLGWGRSPISAGAKTLVVPKILSNLRLALSKRQQWPGLRLVRLYTDPMVGDRPGSKI